MGYYWDDVTAQARTGKTTKNTGNAKKAVTRTPAQYAINKEAGKYVGPGVPYSDAQKWVEYQLGSSAPATPQVPKARSGSGTSGGGRSYGGGGGGGGGGNAKALAQSQMDMLTQLLSSGAYTAPRNDAAYQANQLLRTRVGDSAAADQATGTTAYNGLDAWLNANRTNPYADVQLQRAKVANPQNAYLQSQGADQLNQVTENPDDSYGGFFNALQLLSANQRSGDTSRLAESQMARVNTSTNIDAAKNGYLAGVDVRDANLAGEQQKAQQALDAEKRQTIAQLITLIAQGAKAPDLIKMGVYAPGGTAQDPYGWAAIAAAQQGGK